MSNPDLKLQGIIHRTIIKAPVLDTETGSIDTQDLETILHIPLTDGVRLKLPDLASLQNGESIHIRLANVALNLDLKDVGGLN